MTSLAWIAAFLAGAVVFIWLGKKSEQDYLDPHNQPEV